MGKEYWDLLKSKDVKIDTPMAIFQRQGSFVQSAFFGGKNKPTHQNLIHYQWRPNHYSLSLFP